MSYVEQVLQPGEQVLTKGKLHWILYLPGLVWLIAGAVVGLLAVNGIFGDPQYDRYLMYFGLILAAIGVIRIIYAKFIQWTTEIAVTDRRVIQKKGFISRDTSEININQVESVEVDQSFAGRLLGYGTLRVFGSGHGMEALSYVASPLELRSSITAR